MINKRSIRIFFITLSFTFLMAIASHFNVNRMWVSPLPKSTPPPESILLKKIEAKLELKQNNFELNKNFIPVVSAGSEYDQASAYAVVDFDSGQVVVSKNLSTKLPMASLTKIMTAVVALDLAQPDEYFTVSKRASQEVPTKVMLKTGERFSLQNLLQHALISSANDSSQAIKEGIDEKYGADVFIKAMNMKAKFLGLKNTHFTNSKGYDNPEHFSTVEDLSVLSAYAMKRYPLITQIVSKEVEDLTGGRDLRFYLNNWNGLLGVYPGVSGIKIGNTGKAGNCTIVLSERGNKKLLAVILGAPGVLERDFWTAELLDIGFSKSAGLPPVNVTEDQLRAKYASWKYSE